MTSQRPMNFAENLKRLSWNHASVSEICRKTGINRQQYARYLNGENLPSGMNLHKLSSFFDVSMDELFYGESHQSTNRYQNRKLKNLDLINKAIQQESCPDLLDGVYREYYKSFAVEKISHSVVVIKTQNNVRMYDAFAALTANSGERTLLRHSGVLSGIGGVYCHMEAFLPSQTEISFGLLKRTTGSYRNEYSGYILSKPYNGIDVNYQKTYLQMVENQQSLLSLCRQTGYYDFDSPEIERRIRDYILGADKQTARTNNLYKWSDGKEMRTA